MSAFQSWLDRFFDSYYRSRPVDATFIGHHEHDVRLPDGSTHGVDSLVQETRSLLDSLPNEPLSGAEEVDRELARGFLEIQTWELASGHFHSRNPAWYTGEAIFGLFSLLLRDFAPLEERLDSARARLGAIPALLHQGRFNLREAPRSWTLRAMRECEAAIDFVDDGLPRIPGSSRLSATAALARRAFVDYRAHLQEHLLESSDASPAAGEEAFALLLSRGHFLEWTAFEIAARAGERLYESRAELAAGARRLGFSDAPAALAELENVHPSPERYYRRYRELWDESRAFAEERELLTWPDYPLDFVPRPSWAQKAAPKLYFLFYRSPAPLDALPRVEYLVTPLEPGREDSILRSTNESVIKLNHVLHHGGIGHHVQNWHAMRAESRIGRVAAVDGASRIAMSCGGTMAEGWASYATDLMEEHGFLTPLESLSQHHARARAAARAIVDVRLHHGTMSADEAERFYREHAGMSSEAARAEVTKNGMFPGAAVIYFVGTSLVHDLRRRLAPTLGLAVFHDRFLAHGSIPVSLIARRMLIK